ncbi:MAG: hypothetical protein HQL09_06450 [Nitrospirae bacterium]|nr:hypothetical protein [Nitrospirota bacterium]
MAIDPISNSYPQPQNSVKSDFKTFTTDLQSLQSAMSSGNEDQVTLSESALSTALTRLESDFSNSTQEQSSSGDSGQTQNPLQTFQNDLKTLQSALSASSNSEDSSSSNSTLSTAVNNVMNDLSAMKSRHHHHHASGDGDSSNNSITGDSSQTRNPMQTFQSDLLTLQSELTSTLDTSSSDSTLFTALNNVVNDLSAMNSQGRNTSSSSDSQGVSSSNSNLAPELSQIISLFVQEQTLTANGDNLNTLV